MSNGGMNHRVWIAAALALLVSVMTSPIRPSHRRDPRTGPIYLRRSFSAPSRPARLSLNRLSPRVSAIKAVRAESEEEKLVRATCSTGRFLSAPLSHRPSGSTPPGVSPGFISTSQPLRC